MASPCKQYLVHHLTFEPKGSRALTLAVQHVAAAAEEEQDKPGQTPAPSPGRTAPRDHRPAPRCGSLRTLRGAIGAANSRFHPAGEQAERQCPCPLSAVAFCNSLEKEEVQGGEAPGFSTGSSELSPPGEFTAVPCYESPSSGVQQQAGGRGGCR
ncbi:unnamed protein product [Pleuronectes platessa]|uniref:Uncharacterized protein n=1 Tax=Pleuronectes platessa TaxID=8262 RepID=A0A9N7VUQ8_PLEPL|nr:unnamed protein product [Pleuronectes platessa]